jgi:pyruvate/2-oxoglutarate dehydrogenase complex dihydrolipoamide dehydrogenase (E3) component
MEVQIEKAGVETVLNTVATPELVRKANPVGVFLAPGAEPVVPRIPGVDLPIVHTAEKVIKDEMSLPGSVAIVGTGLTGLETAEMLADRGSKITMIEMLPGIGPGLFPVILGDIMERINKHNPAVFIDHKLIGIAKDSVTLLNMKDSEEVHIPTDHVVLALGVVPRRGLVETFEMCIDNVIGIGDAVKGGRIYDAIKDGFTKAYAFKG